MYPTASITRKDVIMQPGVNYSLGSLLEYSEAENTGDAIINASLTLFPAPYYSLSGTFVSDAFDPFYGYVIKGTVDTGSQPAWGSLAAGSLTVPTDYVDGTLELRGWYQLYFLNSDANNAPWIVSYSFSQTFSVGPSALFTTGTDQVNFNSLTPGQKAAVDANRGALYNALGGNDNVILPDTTSIQTAKGTVTWNPNTWFIAGPGSNVTITGGKLNDHIQVNGPSADTIEGGAGVDDVKYTGGTFGVGDKFKYDKPSQTATYGNYEIQYFGNTTDSSGTPGVSVRVTNSVTGISDLLSNVEYIQFGSSTRRIPLAAIQVNVTIDGNGGGHLKWSLNGKDMAAGNGEQIYYDPTLPLSTGTYQAIFRTGGKNGPCIELSDTTSGQSDYRDGSFPPAPSSKAVFVQIHGGNTSQNSAGCLVGSKIGTPLGSLLTLLTKQTGFGSIPPTPSMPETANKTIFNAISTNSAYITTPSGLEADLAFKSQPVTLPKLKSTESFYQLPIPISVTIANNAVSQPTLRLTDQGSGSISQGRKREADDFTRQLRGSGARSRHSRTNGGDASHGAPRNSIQLKGIDATNRANRTPSVSPITWIGSVGQFEVTIHNQTGGIPPNKLASPPTGVASSEFYLVANSATPEAVAFSILGYRARIPDHGVNTPPGAINAQSSNKQRPSSNNCTSSRLA